MSWAETIKINSNMAKSLDTLINEKITSLEGKITSLSTQISTLQTSLNNKTTIKSIQRGISQVSYGSKSTVVKISAVNISKTIVNIAGYGGYGGIAPYEADVFLMLKSSTELVIERNSSGSTVSNLVSWEVVEFY